VRRRAFMIAAGATLLRLQSADAERPVTIPTIGVLVPGSPPRDVFDVFRDALYRRGYKEARSINIEACWSGDDTVEKWADLTSDLINQNVSLVLAGDTNGALAARRVTTTVPIVATTLTDPIASA
jgi:putative ABC transport system substrate-binding protein